METSKDVSLLSPRQRSAARVVSIELAKLFLLRCARTMDMRAGGVPSPPENVKVRLFSEAIFLRKKEARGGERGGAKKLKDHQ